MGLTESPSNLDAKSDIGCITISEKNIHTIPVKNIVISNMLTVHAGDKRGFPPSAITEALPASALICSTAFNAKGRNTRKYISGEARIGLTDAPSSVDAISDVGCKIIWTNNTHMPAVKTTATNKIATIHAGEKPGGLFFSNAALLNVALVTCFQ